MENDETLMVIKSFNKIARLPDKWDHNRQYQNYLLKLISGEKGIGLDLGCGTGEFTRLLSNHCTRVVGIDISPKMVAEATKRNIKDNISYSVITAESFLSNKDSKYSVIISIASLHHMEPLDIFKLVKKALKPGGQFIVLDILKEESLLDYLYSGISSILSPIFVQIENGTTKQSKEEILAWKEHAPLDHYNTLREIKEYANKIFGNYTLKRHLFWRYTLVFRK